MKKYLLPLLLILCLLCACGQKQQAGDQVCSVTVDVLDAQASLPLVEFPPSFPADGILLQKEVPFTAGDSAYDVMLRVLQEEKLHYEVDATKYFLAIGNIYAGDFGDLSGWLYTVNGESLTVGASQYTLQDGDVLRFYYVTTFG